MEATIVPTYFLNGHVYAMDENEAILEAVEPTRRRRHSKEFKEKVIRAAMQPNVSIAAVALHYRLNANLLRRWVAAREEQDAASEARQSLSMPPAEFIPLQLEAPGAAAVPTEIQIEVRRGAATVTVRWPLCAAADCAAWLQGWLR
ncbi:IS66-like element accessory protein TnpA [Burkholderia ubonensis]|uniref:IS66-like element accessory protein TnpA n=1 Tax=Burkholderia ubonensis TaxID=101571 RepID=UPI0009B4A1B3|nr:transposase [Burkholderia ubonensis]